MMVLLYILQKGSPLLMTDLHEKIQEITPVLFEIRRDLHRHPELSEQEVRTEKQICLWLRKWGIPYQDHVAGHGIVALIEGKKTSVTPKKTVGIRADMDALPITESSSHICCSQTSGVMHACGHDAHVAITLGVAKILKDMEYFLSGNVKFFFQPAEETIGGANRMISCGYMEHPHVDYMIGLHVMPNHESGTVEYRYGKLNASSDHIDITVHGKSCHGAYPEQGIDAIVIASHLICSLQTLVSRSLSPLQSAVLSFGKIEGGERPNILCDCVTIQGTLRTTDPEVRAHSLFYIEKQASLIAKSFGGSADVAIQKGYDALINHDEVMTVIVQNAAQLLGKQNLYQKDFPSLGVEDFSFFLAKTPGAFFHLGCGNKKEKKTAPLHSSDFELDESCIPIGVELQVMNVFSLLAKETDFAPKTDLI